MQVSQVEKVLELAALFQEKEALQERLKELDKEIEAASVAAYLALGEGRNER